MADPTKPKTPRILNGAWFPPCRKLIKDPVV